MKVPTIAERRARLLEETHQKTKAKRGEVRVDPTLPVSGTSTVNKEA